MTYIFNYILTILGNGNGASYSSSSPLNKDAAVPVSPSLLNKEDAAPVSPSLLNKEDDRLLDSPSPVKSIGDILLF